MQYHEYLLSAVMLIMIKQSKMNTQFCSLPLSLIVILLSLCTVGVILSCSFPINFLFKSVSVSCLLFTSVLFTLL